MGSVLIDTESCKGCGLCVSFCPKQVVKLGGGLNQLGYHTAEVILGDAAKGCNACARCALMCPDAAITVYR